MCVRVAESGYRSARTDTCSHLPRVWKMGMAASRRDELASDGNVFGTNTWYACKLLTRTIGPRPAQRFDKRNRCLVDSPSHCRSAHLTNQRWANSSTSRERTAGGVDAPADN